MIKLLILFQIFFTIKCSEFYIKFDHNDENKCLNIDTSKIGLIYLYMPLRNLDLTGIPDLNKDGIVFKTHHYYSLISVTKLFKPSKRNRLLFYYINKSGRPVNNHYNQWLNDTHWSSKIPIESIKFIQINSNLTDDFNLYDIVNRIKKDSMKRFDTIKEKYLLITSDMILGPKIQSCFTKDFINDHNSNYDFLDIESIKNNIQIDCFKSINKLQSYYSFLYKLDSLHNPIDFSGVFIWDSSFKNDITKDMVNYNNIYKCHYRNDILAKSAQTYEDSYCVFGFELNAYEPPIFQNLFYDKHTYFYKLMRKYLFNKSEHIEYKLNHHEAKIPNVVHLIWFASPFKQLKFIEYLCLKSILKVIKPDKIRIHGDNEPVNCNYWNEIKKDPKIEWVYRPRPLFKYGQNFTNSPIQHLADVSRLEVLYEEGGIYSDFDILWVKPVDKYRYYDVDLVASNDITSYCFEFPFNIQIGAFMAPANSKFLLKWLNGYKEKYHLFPGDYVAVSMCEPYKLYEKEPYNVLIDNRFQMIYFNGWSAFIPRYIDVDQDNLKEFNDNLDWLNDGTHGYHLPRHGDLFTKEEYEKSNKTSLPIKIASYIFNLN